MENTPDEIVEPPNLRFLRRLVTVLTAVMILGLLTITVLLVIRLSTPGAPALPDTVTLPEGVRAQAVTYGAGWYAVVTEDQRILVFAADGELRQDIVLDVD